MSTVLTDVGAVYQIGGNGIQDPTVHLGGITNEDAVKVRTFFCIRLGAPPPWAAILCTAPFNQSIFFDRLVRFC